MPSRPACPSRSTSRPSFVPVPGASSSPSWWPCRRRTPRTACGRPCAPRQVRSCANDRRQSRREPSKLTVGWFSRKEGSGRPARRSAGPPAAPDTILMDASMSPSKWPALPPLPAVLVGILSVQGGAALAKGLFPALGPSGTVGLRIGISALILLAAFRPGLRRLNAAQWRVVVLYGVVLGVMNLVFYHSLSRIPLGLAVTVEFIGPLSVAVFGSRKLIDTVWVVLAGAGIALITPWTAGSGVDPLGVAFAFAAGVCWALYIVIGKRLSHLLSGGAAVSIGMLVAAVAVVPFAAPAGGFAHVTAGRFAACVGVALLSSAIPYTLEMIALKAMPVRTFGILMSLEPAIAALVGLALLREVLSPTQWLAVALVIAASAGSTLSSRSAPEPLEADAREGWQGG